MIRERFYFDKALKSFRLISSLSIIKVLFVNIHYLVSFNYSRSYCLQKAFEIQTLVIFVLKI